MNNEYDPDSPVVPGRAPEHGPNFWNQLDAALQDGTATGSSGASTAGLDATSQMPQIPNVDGAAGGAAIGGGHTGTTQVHPAVPLKQGARALWPLAVAAVALVVLGLGFLAVRGPGDPAATTEIVSAPDPAADAASADAADGDANANADNAPATETANGSDTSAAGDTSPASDTSAAGDTSPDSNTSAAGDTSVDNEDTTSSDGSATTDSGDITVGDTQGAAGDGGDGDTDTAVATPVPAPPIPDFAAARGAVGEPEHLPLDGGVAADGTYLANWSDRRLTWYAVNDPSTNCASARYSEILYVNRSGITQEMRDPQLRFSGEVSHFVVNSEQDLAAWVVACGSQLELFVATLEPTGRISELTLAWFGEGSTSTALVLWDSNEVSLNAIEPDGQTFAVDYNVETGLLSRNGGPPRIMLEAGAPAERSLTPIAASPDGGLTYWTGTAPAGTVSECKELFGSGRSDTLWLRQGEGQWRLAAAGDFPLGTVTAAALDPDALRLAFADVCSGESGRVLVGTQLADGRIGDLQEIDLTPFVPGYVAQLFWVDDTTLRIETDNSEFGFGTVRFDYRLDQELIVQLD